MEQTGSHAHLPYHTRYMADRVGSGETGYRRLLPRPGLLQQTKIFVKPSVTVALEALSRL